MRLDVDPDIHAARLPPAALYRDADWQHALRERVLARTWHVLATAALPRGHVQAHTLLPGELDQPVLRTCDPDGGLHLLSNACSHRGHLLVDPDRAPGPARLVRCGYHGRRFGLDGHCQGSPGFSQLVDADLPALAGGTWGPLSFASLDPVLPLADWLSPLALLGDPADLGPHLPDDDREHQLDVHWALYVDNYLEGLHIPFVHPALARAVDLERYVVELLPWGVLQLGLPPPGQAGQLVLADGRRVAAAWLWLFPATMLNFYPWGLSLNVVQPAGPGRTRVLYRSFVRSPELRRHGAGGDLDTVEAEDQQAVARVQQGLASRSWRGGGYAPRAELGVHHFHRLLARCLESGPPLPQSSGSKEKLRG